MPDLPEAIAIVERGDAAWDSGQRAAAVADWRRALVAASEGVGNEHSAAQAMAHLRLVHVEGNLAPFWHEAPWNRALLACPAAVPWCALARADREILVPEAGRRALLWTPRVWPGAVLVGGEVAGTWRRDQRLVALSPWRRLSPKERGAIEAEALSLPLPGVAGSLVVRWED